MKKSLMTKMQPNNFVVRAGMLFLTAVAMVACGHADENKGTKADGRTTPTQEVAIVESPTESSDVSFKGEDGNTVELSALHGKVLFINFWATWCPPCIHEMPSINELRQSFKGNDNIMFLMVDVDNNMIKSSAFMKENNYDLPVYVPASNIPSDYLGGAIPTTVIIDKDGNIVARMEGGRDYSDPEITIALNELISK